MISGVGAGFISAFWSNGPVRVALAVGGGAAVVCAVVGLSTVMRRQSFAGHALADISGAGGSAAYLLGINPLLGFIGLAGLAAGVMEMAQVQEARERDLVTGVVLGAGLGLAALLLYLDVTLRSVSNAAISILFGSMFSIAPSIVPTVLAIAVIALAASVLVFRPLLVSSLSVDMARAQGVNVRTASLVHALALALAVALAAITVGAILATALLIGPAAAALQVARKPVSALVLAVAIGLGATWGGIVLAYDSFYWTLGHGWPVSFFIVMLIGGAYVLTSVLAHRDVGALTASPLSGCQER